MKIYYISGSKIPSKTANSIHVMKMAQAIARLGYDVTLFAKNNNTNSNINPINNYEFYNVENIFSLQLIKVRVKLGNGIYYAICVILKLLFSSRKKSLVYGRDFYSVALAGLLGFKTIFESHSFYKSRKRSFIEHVIFNNKRFQKLVVISNSLKHTYIENFPKLKNIEVHHDGADIENKPVIDLKWYGRKDKLQVGYVGHLYPGRGIDIIIKCSEVISDYDFNIIGGNDSDIEFWSKTFRPNVFFHGFKQQSEIPSIMKKCDILLMPYQTEVGVADSALSTVQWMSPMKLFEYMASNRVIISSDLPVLREVLNDNNSILVNPSDIDEWVNALKILSDSKIRQKLASRALNDLTSKYTWSIRASNIMKNI